MRALLAALLLAALAAVWQWRAATAADARAAVAESQRDSWRKAFADATTARAEEARRAHQLQEAADAHHQARLAAEADARRADAAAVGLRERAHQLAAAGRCAGPHPAAAIGSAPASAPSDLLADMLSRLDQAAGDIGRYADSARDAGRLCERSYDALMER